MSKKGKVKMGLGDFLGKQAGATQPIKGHILPSGPDPNRDPDERRGPGGRRHDDDDGPGARSDGADQWRRGPGGGGGGMDRGGRAGGGGGGGYDHERGGIAPEGGTWRAARGAPPPRAGGGSMGRDSGYDNPPPSSESRPRLQLQSRKAPPPLPPMVPKEEKADSPVPTPARKPAGPRSNPFGAAQAVDTTQRDKEIEAKAEAARQAALRRRDESIRSGKPADGGEDEEGGEKEGDAAAGADDAGKEDAPADATDEVENTEAAGAEGDENESEPAAAKEGDAEGGPAKAKVEPPKPVGRWAALRREGGGDDRSSAPASGGFPRRDREDDRRGSGGSGRDGERPSFGRRNEGDSAGGGGGFGGRGMEREPFQPPAPPAGNAFAKRFGSNFNRDSERSYPRPNAGGMGGRAGGFERRDDDRRGGGIGGGAFDRRDDDRRGSGGGGGGFDGGRIGGGGGFDRQDDRRGGGMGGSSGGGYDRRDEGRGGGGGMGMGSSRFSRDSHDDGGFGGGGAYRRPGAGSPEARSSPLSRPSGGEFKGGGGSSTSPPPSLSKVSIKESKEPVKEVAAAPEPEPEAEPEPEREPEPEPEPEKPKEDPVEVARSSAVEALASGKRGKELKEFVLAQEKRTTAGALLAAALEGATTPEDMKWLGKDEFGPALTALSTASASDSMQQQMGMIYAVVAKCHEMGFPKVAGAAVVQTIFMGMYNDDLCEEEAFIEWKDDVDSTAEGRMKAVMQTTPWFVWLESVEAEDEDED